MREFFQKWFLLFSLQLSLAAAALPADAYQKGLQLKAQGRWQQALAFWQAARNSLKTPDARVGIAFIELATTKEAVEFYPAACEMYFWALSPAALLRHPEIAQQELDRLAPLLAEEQRSRWQTFVQQEPAKLLHEIKAFWVRKDPIPTTESNERLLEHWGRIAHGRENFRKTKITPYSSDDRGLVFVKYGPPDDQFHGKLGNDQFEIIRWLDDFLLRQEVQRYNTMPEYEIWIYHGLQDESSTVFLFGKKSGFGKYGLRAGIEEFIPERAFRRSSTRTTKGLLPGAMLQLMYYRELISLDKFFEDRYRELETLWANSRASGDLGPDYDVINGLVEHYAKIDEARAAFLFLPLDQSAVLNGLEPLQIKNEIFRYLDENDNSRLRILMISEDQIGNAMLQRGFFETAPKTRYQHRHILVNYDHDWQMVWRSVAYPALENSNTSVFDLNYKQATGHYALVAEKTILPVRKARLDTADLPDTSQVVGLSSLFLDSLPPPLAGSGSFELSDILLGSKPAPGLQQMWGDSLPIIPQQRLSGADSITVYVEIYNLQSSAAPLNLELAVFPENQERPVLKEALALPPFTGHQKKYLIVDIRKLPAGAYRIHLTAGDSQAVDKKISTKAFTILPNSE